MEDKVPEIDLKLETREIKGGESFIFLVKHMYGTKGWGRINCIWNWLIYRAWKFESYKSFINSPVKFVTLPPVVMCHADFDSEMFSRYAEKEINPKYYSTMSISGSAE